MLLESVMQGNSYKIKEAAKSMHSDYPEMFREASKKA